MDIGKVNKVSRIKQAYESSVSKKPEEKKSTGTGTDTVEISDKSQELSRLQSKMDTESEVRTEKVDALKEQIDNGQYKVDSEKVSEKILDEFS